MAQTANSLFGHRGVTVGTSAAQPVTSSHPAWRKCRVGAWVKMDPDNTGTVYFGSTNGVNATANDADRGIPLAAGEAHFFPFNADVSGKNIEELWCKGSASGQNFTIWWM